MHVHRVHQNLQPSLIIRRARLGWGNKKCRENRGRRMVQGFSILVFYSVSCYTATTSTLLRTSYIHIYHTLHSSSGFFSISPSIIKVWLWNLIPLSSWKRIWKHDNLCCCYLQNQLLLHVIYLYNIDIFVQYLFFETCREKTARIAVSLEALLKY